MRRAHKIEHGLNDLEISPLLARADIVRLPSGAIAQHNVYSVAMIVDMNPMPHLKAIAIDRERSPLHHIGDHEGNKLLRILIWPVRIRSSGDNGIETVGFDVGRDQHLS